MEQKHLPCRKRQEIPYFYVGKTPGGNQDWFVDGWMHIGGCAALAACDMCICMARHHDKKDCIPFHSEHILISQYVEFGMIMKPFIRPRVGGVIKLTSFTKGLGRYLKTRGYETVFDCLSADESYEKAESFLKRAVHKKMPVAFLLLLHKNEKFKDLTWHWFTLTGYELIDDKLFVIYHTYGGKYKVDFQELWDSGIHKKGGMITITNCIKTD